MLLPYSRFWRLRFRVSALLATCAGNAKTLKIPLTDTVLLCPSSAHSVVNL